MEPRDENYNTLIQQLIDLQEKQILILRKMKYNPYKDVEQAPTTPVIVSEDSGFQFNIMQDAEINAQEVKHFGGGEMTEEELSRHFGEPLPQKTENKKLLNMTQSEINAAPIEKLQNLVREAEDDEAAADNATDLYKIKARVANIARGGSMSLTPQGEILCNSFVHMLKSLYDYADSKKDRELKRLIRSCEGVPGDIIAASMAGVRMGPKR